MYNKNVTYKLLFKMLGTRSFEIDILAKKEITQFKLILHVTCISDKYLTKLMWILSRYFILNDAITNTYYTWYHMHH